MSGNHCNYYSFGVLLMAEEYKERSDAGEGYSLDYNRVSRGAGLDRVSACRTLRFAAIHDLLMVSQEHGSDHSIPGENLHSL